jgi:hypothetical protein
MFARRRRLAIVVVTSSALACMIGCSLLVDTAGFDRQPADGGAPPTDSPSVVDGAADASFVDGGDAAQPITSKYAAAVLADQPLAYWRMGAPVSGAIRDETGRGNDLRLMGAVTGYTAASPGALKGDSDPAARLDGKTAWFEALRPRDLDLVGSSVTVEAWVRLPAQQVGFERYQQLVSSSDDSGGNRHGYLLYVNTVDRTCAVEWSPPVVDLPGAGDVYAPDAWMHVAATYDATENRVIIYFNSTERDRKNVSGALVARVSAFVVGGDHYPGESVLNGDIDEVAVYPRALTQMQLAKHYFVGITE